MMDYFYNTLYNPSYEKLLRWEQKVFASKSLEWSEKFGDLFFGRSRSWKKPTRHLTENTMFENYLTCRIWFFQFSTKMDHFWHF